MERKARSKGSDVKNHTITKWTMMDEWAKKEKDRELKFHIDKLIEKARVALEQTEQKTDKTYNSQGYASNGYASNANIIQNEGYASALSASASAAGAAGMAGINGMASNYSNDIETANGLILANKFDAHHALPIVEAQTASQTAPISIEIDANALAANSAHRTEKLEKTKLIEEVIGQAAARIAKEIGANCVASIERKGMDIENRDHLNVQVSIFRRHADGNIKRVEYQTRMRKVMSGSVVPIKELLMEAINKKYVNKGDRIVCVEDESLGMGYKGLLFIFDVDKIFFNISTLNLANNISPEVLEAVINIALEISKEGREGKKIGTAFVIAPKEESAKYTKQMIINPFSGYPEEIRKITNIDMRETVKEFAQLDGIFMIDESGTIVSAGTHLNVDASTIDLPGYGTRHRCCAAMTKVCNSIAVVVSESGGKISIFKAGKLVMKLP